MTPRTRYFLYGSTIALLLGIGGGLVAYYQYNRAAGVPAGLPVELRYVPADAQMVAYADVQTVMASDMRRELEGVALGRRRGQQQMHEFAGIDLEKDVNHVIAYLQPEAGDPNPQRPPNGLILAQGKFDQARTEQFIKDHAGSVEDYHGKHLIAGPMNDRGRGGPAFAFLQPGLIAMGPIELVRKAIDDFAGTETSNITSNTELMNLIRDASSGNAWVVGRFDAVSRRVGLPPSIAQQVPAVRLVSASARINGGVKATIKAEAGDKAAADQLRDVVRGAVSFARIQAGSKPEFQDALNSVEIGGAGNNVQLSFMMTAATFKALTPPRPPRADQLPPAPQP